MAILLASAPVPVDIAIAAGHAAMWVPAMLLAEAILPSPAHRRYSWLLAFPLSLVLALGIGLAGQFWLGITPRSVIASLAGLTLLGGWLIREKTSAWDRADVPAVLVLGATAFAVPILYASFDPNHGNLTAYDSWYTFSAIQDIVRNGRLSELGLYPRGVHYFYSFPHVLAGRAHVSDFVAAVNHYRIHSFFALSSVTWLVARTLGIPRYLAIACGLSVYLFNPGGTPSPWHVMPRAASLVLVPTLLLLSIWLGQAASRRVAAFAALLVAGSIYLHELTAVVLALLSAAFFAMRGSRSWVAPAFVAVFFGIVFFPPEVFPFSDRIPLVGTLFRSKYYPVDPVTSHSFAFYPLTFTLTILVATGIVLFSSVRSERGVALFAALLPIGTSGAYVPERWLLYLQPFAFTLVLLAAKRVRHARLPAATPRIAAVIGCALLATVVVSHTAYWAWAQADASPGDLALYDATVDADCIPVTDSYTRFQLTAANPSAVDDLGVFRGPDVDASLRPYAQRGPVCLAITGRTSKWLATQTDVDLVLPAPFAAHPDIVKFANRTRFERLHASPDDDAFLLRYRGPNASYVSPTVIVASNDVAESDNNTRSRWVTETALFRLGPVFETRPAENLSAAQLATIDTLVIPTDDLAWRFPGQQAISISEFVRDGGHVVALAGPYGDLNGLFGVQSLSEVQVHTRAIHWDTPAGRATTELKYEIDSHRYTLTPDAEVLARDDEGRPVVWRTHVGQGTVVVAPLQRLPAGNDVYHLLKAMWLFAQDEDEKAIAAATVPPPPGYSPIHEPSYRFYTWWRDLQAPHYAWAKPLIIVGSLAAVVAASVRETVLWIRARRAGEPHTR